MKTEFPVSVDGLLALIVDQLADPIIGFAVGLIALYVAVKVIACMTTTRADKWL